jgi:hypothetical protein
MDAFYTDERPALAAWREGRGLPADPMAAYAASGTQGEAGRRARRRRSAELGRVTRRSALLPDAGARGARGPCTSRCGATNVSAADKSWRRATTSCPYS